MQYSSGISCCGRNDAIFLNTAAMKVLVTAVVVLTDVAVVDIVVEVVC